MEKISAQNQQEHLRQSVHQEMDEALQDRLSNIDLSITGDELRLGAFMEELEPQVRNALIVLNKKGYKTHSSGFYGSESGQGDLQAIDMEGNYSLDEEIVKKLNDMGVRVGFNE